jgi:hypothetical protein
MYQNQTTMSNSNVNEHLKKIDTNENKWNHCLYKTVLEMKIWMYWSESNSWSYFYIVRNKNWKIYWFKRNFSGLGSENRCSSWGLWQEKLLQNSLLTEPKYLTNIMNGLTFFCNMSGFGSKQSNCCKPVFRRISYK